MSRRLTISVTLIALVIGSNPALEAQRSRGSVSSARGTYSHSGNTGSVQGQHASGTRTVNQTGSGATATRQAQTQSGATRSTTRQVDAENRRDRQDDDRHYSVGRVGDPVPGGRGSRWLRDRRGEREDQHRAFGLRRSRGGPHLLRPAGGRRNGQHEIQRHLQRRRRPHAVWRVQHRGGRPVRRTCDDHVAIGVQDVDILRSLLLHLRRHVLPALYIWWRPLLLPRSATLLLVLQLPSSRRDHSHNCWASSTWCRRTATTASRRRPATERRHTRRCPRRRAPRCRRCRRRACS